MIADSLFLGLAVECVGSFSLLCGQCYAKMSGMIFVQIPKLSNLDCNNSCLINSCRGFFRNNFLLCTLKRIDS